MGFPKVWSQLKSHQAPQVDWPRSAKMSPKPISNRFPSVRDLPRKILGNKKFSIQSVASCQLPELGFSGGHRSHSCSRSHPGQPRNRGRYAWPRITSQRFGADPPIGPIDFQYRNSHCVVDWGHPGVIPLCSSRWDLRSHSQSSQPHATPAFSANA